MSVKMVKVYLGLLWSCCGQCGVSSFLDSSLVWLIFLKIYTSKAVPSVLASSVCWSLQCPISALTQGGRWWTLFLGSLVQLCCGEGGTLQTNNTGVCSQCLSHTGPAPAHGACALLPHSATEQVSLKKVSTTALLVSGQKSDTEETSKQKKLKQREPPWK